jgi:hypothetical protein
MENFQIWFAKSPIASAFRVALGYALGNMVADFAKVGDFNFTNYKSWLIGALVVFVPLFLRAINPQDKAFGVGAPQG